MGLALSAAFRQILVPSITRNVLPTREGQAPVGADDLAALDPSHPRARARHARAHAAPPSLAPAAPPPLVKAI